MAEEQIEQIEVETPIVETPAVVPVSLKDDDVVEVVVRGERVLKPWKEARAGVQMQEDYTRGKQEIAAKARELKTLYDGLTERQKAIVEKETGIDQILGRATPRSQHTPPPNPDEVLTYGRMQELLAAKEAELTSKVTTLNNETKASLESQRQFQRWDDMTQDTVGRLVKENPVLETIPQLSEMLKREARQDNPQTEQEMVTAIVKRGKAIAEKLDAHYVQVGKQRAIRKQELSTKGPEPRGGTPQYRTEKTYGNGRNIDWKALESDVISAIEGLDD